MNEVKMWEKRSKTSGEIAP